MFNLLIDIMTSALSGCLVAFLHIGYERATIKKVTNNQHLINPLTMAVVRDLVYLDVQFIM